MGRSDLFIAWARHREHCAVGFDSPLNNRTEGGPRVRSGQKISQILRQRSALTPMQEDGWLSSDSDDEDPEQSWLAMEPVHRRSSLDHQFPSNSRDSSVLEPEAGKMNRRRASRVSMRRVEDGDSIARLIDESIGQADLLEELEKEGSFVLHINEWGALTPNSVAYKAQKREEVLHAK